MRVCGCVHSPDHPLLGHVLAANVRVKVGQLISLQIQQQDKGVSLQLGHTHSEDDQMQLHSLVPQTTFNIII